MRPAMWIPVMRLWYKSSWTCWHLSFGSSSSISMPLLESALPSKQLYCSFSIYYAYVSQQQRQSKRTPIPSMKTNPNPVKSKQTLIPNLKPSIDYVQHVDTDPTPKSMLRKSHLSVKGCVIPGYSLLSSVESMSPVKFISCLQPFLQWHMSSLLIIFI